MDLISNLLIRYPGCPPRFDQASMHLHLHCTQSWELVFPPMACQAQRLEVLHSVVVSVSVFVVNRNRPIPFSLVLCVSHAALNASVPITNKDIFAKTPSSVMSGHGIPVRCLKRGPILALPFSLSLIHVMPLPAIARH